MNRFPLIFGEVKGGLHDAAIKAFLITCGVPVAYIRDTASKDKGDTRATIKLDMANNEFTGLLTINLEVALKKIRDKIKEAAAAQ